MVVFTLLIILSTVFIQLYFP